MPRGRGRLRADGPPVSGGRSNKTASFSLSNEALLGCKRPLQNITSLKEAT